MIVRPRLNWLRMLLVWRGSVLPVIAPQLLFMTALAIVVTLLHGEIFRWKIPLNFGAFSLVGLTLAIFLGFRNSTSYARWWEARTLWGTLLNETRSLLRQGMTLVDDRVDHGADEGADNRANHGADEPRREAPHATRLAILLIAFVHALRHQLRRTDSRADLTRLLPAADVDRLCDARFKPALLLLMAGEWIRARLRDGSLAPVIAPALEGPLGKLTEALGGCERIAATPIPFTYAVIIHRTIFGYCVLLPFGLVDTIGAMTPVIVLFIAYTFFALEALAGELEEPFGVEPNDLALDAMSRTIEETLREMLGERLEAVAHASHEPDIIT